MNARRIVKLALLVVMSVSTLFISSKIVAQRNRRGRSIPASTKISRVSATQSSKSSRPPVADENSAPVKMIAEFNFDSMTLTPAPGRVGINAKVSMQDSRFGTSYMWAVRVKDHGEEKVLSQLNYDTQIFSIRPNEHRDLTFKDVIPVRAGTYHVELRLYELSPNAKAPQVLLARVEKVIIP